MKNLVVKLIKVMTGVKRVAKNGRNTFQNYDYVTEADVLEAVRDELAKENIFIFSSVIGTDKNAEMTSVVMLHTFVDAESGETFEVKSFGQGQDKGDKGGNKAVTAAMKYFLMKNFLIPTGDDSEASDENGKSTGPKSVKLASGGSGKGGATDTTVAGGIAVNTIQGAEPKKYGFSGKAKPAVAVAAAPTVVTGADEF